MGIKTIIITTEVQIDEDNICKKYSNFNINFESRFNYRFKKYLPTKKGLKEFARRFVSQEKAMRTFGFTSKVVDVRFKD